MADWTIECAGRFAATQASLFARGDPVGFTDAMIAPDALVLGTTPVTNNQRHFSQVEGLPLENWFVPG